MAISTVRLTLAGLLIMLIEHDRGYCDIGIPLRVPHHHKPRMRITQHLDSGAVIPVKEFGKQDFRDAQFELRVENSPHEDAVTLFTPKKPKFCRATDEGHYNDFRWAMDFEGHELHCKPIGIIPPGCLSWLRICGGHFFTDKKSIDRLEVTDQGGHKETLGKAAVRIGANIELDRADSRAVLFRRPNGGAYLEEVYRFSPSPGVNYGLELNQAMPPGTKPQPGEPSHADYYYHAVGRSELLPASQKKKFKSDPATSPDDAEPVALDKLIDPRVICFVGQMSQTQRESYTAFTESASAQTSANGAAGGGSVHSHDRHGESPRETAAAEANGQGSPATAGGPRPARTTRED